MSLECHIFIPLPEIEKFLPFLERLEIMDEPAGGLISPVRAFFEELEDDFIDDRWDILPEIMRRRCGLGHMLVDESADGLGLEGELSREEPVKCDAQRVKIGSAVDGLVDDPCLFRRHIRECADERLFAADVCMSGEPGKPEIEELRVYGSISFEHDV
jgi:hypothetical protein